MTTSSTIHFNRLDPASHQQAEAPPDVVRMALTVAERVDLVPTAENHQTQEPTDQAKKRVKTKKKVPAQATLAESLRLPELISKESAALALGVSPGTLDVWRSTGRYALPFVKIGRKVLYKLDDLSAFIERRTRSNGATE